MQTEADAVNAGSFFIISPQDAGTTVGRFLRAHGYSARLLSRLKFTENGITVNGERAFTSRVLQAGDRLETELADREADDMPLPLFAPLEIVYEDESLLVIDKPAGMPVHPSRGFYSITLANAVCFHLLASGQNQFVFRAPQRLDRDTTGLILVAKNQLIGARLTDMARSREIRKTYFAVCEGKTPPSGEIDAPIARARAGNIARCVDFIKGDRALTHFERLSYSGGHSLVRLQLLTGRTHQIRVHMSSIGYPLAGDALYGGSCTHISRQALHAGELSLTHPVTGQALHFRAELPEDMARLLAAPRGTDSI